MKGRISSWSEHGEQFVSFQSRPLFWKDLVRRNAEQKKKKSQQMPPYADMTEYLRVPEEIRLHNLGHSYMMQNAQKWPLCNVGNTLRRLIWTFVSRLQKMATVVYVESTKTRLQEWACWSGPLPFAYVIRAFFARCVSYDDVMQTMEHCWCYFRLSRPFFKSIPEAFGIISLH